MYAPPGQDLIVANDRSGYRPQLTRVEASQQLLGNIEQHTRRLPDRPEVEEPEDLMRKLRALWRRPRRSPCNERFFTRHNRSEGLIKTR